MDQLSLPWQTAGLLNRLTLWLHAVSRSSSRSARLSSASGLLDQLFSAISNGRTPPLGGFRHTLTNRLGPRLTEFMRHFLGSEGEEVRKGDVYAAIKRLTADSEPPSVRLLMSRMEQLSTFYSRITTTAPEPDENISEFFVRFRRLDFGTAYPLLLSLEGGFVDGQFGTEEFVASLRILDSYIIS